MPDRHLVKPNLVLLHSDPLGSVGYWGKNRFVGRQMVHLVDDPRILVVWEGIVSVESWTQLSLQVEKYKNFDL